MFSSPRDLTKGIITAWAGAIGNIPPDWFLCDGNNGTPDLRDKFIIATGPIFSVGNESAISEHDHFFESDGHRHGVQVGFNVASGTARYLQSSTNTFEGTTQTGIHLPKYYSLAYIQFQG